MMSFYTLHHSGLVFNKGRYTEMHASLGIITPYPFKDGQNLFNEVLSRLYSLSESRGIIDSLFIGYNPYTSDYRSDLLCMDYISPECDWGYTEKFESLGVPVTYLGDIITMVNMKDMAHLSDEQLFELRPHTVLECPDYKPWMIIENSRFMWEDGRSYYTHYPFWKERLRRHINAGNYFTIMDYHF